MSRTILQADFLWIPDFSDERMLLGPNSRIGSSRGTRIDSLSGVAKRVLLSQGFRILSDIGASYRMRDVLDEFRFRDADAHVRDALSTVSALFRAGLDEAALQHVASPHVLRWCEIALRYRMRLFETRYVSGSDIYFHALKFDASSQSYRIAGYPRLSEIETRWVNHIAGEGSELVLPVTEHSFTMENRERIDWFTRNGWVRKSHEGLVEHAGHQVARRWNRSVKPPSESVSVLEAFNQDQEIRLALKQIKRWYANGVPVENMLLVLRNEPSYAPALQRVANEYSVPLRFHFQSPLVSSRLGRWMQQMFHVIQSGFPYEACLHFLHHPYSGTLISKESRKRLRTKRVQGIDEWKHEIPVFSTWIHENPMPARKWIQWIKQVFEQARISHSVSGSPREVHGFYQLAAALDEWESWTENKPLDAAEVFAQWREILYLTTVPYSPGRGGVSVHTPLAVYGTQYSHAIVLGMVEGEMPPTVRDDTALDDYVREELIRGGVPVETSAERHQREALSFWSMLHSITDTVVFTMPRRIGNRETIPSSYLKTLALTPGMVEDNAAGSLCEKRRHLFHEDASTDPVLTHAHRAFRVEQGRETNKNFDSHDGLVGDAFTLDNHIFSPSGLTTFGQCPFRWFASHALRLKEIEDYDDDLDAATKGKLCHRVLQTLVCSARDKADLQQKCLAQLEETLDMHADEAALTGIPGWAAQRAEMLQQLQTAIRSEDFCKAGDVPEFFEYKISGTWNGLPVRGTVDRIDRTPEGWRILDYKTSSSLPKGAVSSTGKTDLDIQLTLYSNVVSQEFNTPETKIASEYFLIPKGEAKTRKPAEAKEYNLLVEFLKQSMKTGSFPVAPDREENACMYCPHDTVCRKGPRLHGKDAVR